MNKDKFKGFLTVTDMDGTLIDSSHRISEENKRAIREYVQQGGLFAVATGRGEDSIKAYIDGVVVNCPSILYNGAAIYDLNAKEFIKCHYINRSSLVEPLRTLMNEHQDLCVQIFTPGMMYVVSKGQMDPLLDKEGQIYEFVSLDEVAQLEWIKLLLYDTNESLKLVDCYLAENVPDGTINTVFSVSTYLELLPYGATKGSALMDLMQIVGVDREHVTAIGDYCNDIEMIEVAGLGVATRNAHPSLKEVADLTVVSNDENAVHHVIEEVLATRLG